MRGLTMGRLAQMAERHYKEFLPTAYAAIPAAKRPAFFQTKEDEAAEAIEDLADSLAGDDPPDETYQDRVARLRVAQSTAESTVIRETLLPPPEVTEPESDPETDRALSQAIEDFQTAREELAQ